MAGRLNENACIEVYHSFPFSFVRLRTNEKAEWRETATLAFFIHEDWAEKSAEVAPTKSIPFRVSQDPEKQAFVYAEQLAHSLGVHFYGLYTENSSDHYKGAPCPCGCDYECPDCDAHSLGMERLDTRHIDVIRREHNYCRTCLGKHFIQRGSNLDTREVRQRVTAKEMVRV